jgi:hypothetical protein
MRKPRTGEHSVMKMTEVEAMPPMRPHDDAVATTD